MIDKRFSRSEFEALKQNSQAWKNLHKDLEREIASELHSTVSRAFAEIAEKLKALGHELTEESPEYDGDFRSWGYVYVDTKDKNSPRIWLHTQVGVVSD